LPNTTSAIKEHKTFIELYFVVFSKIRIKIFASGSGGGNQLLPVCLVFSLAVLPSSCWLYGVW
jgi:hypothetical protein